MISPLKKLLCPLDRDPLTLSERSWCCEHGHRFDIAKQGYVNLLPVQHKRSKDPGDSKEMIQARHRFLQQGFYQPLAAALADVVLAANEQSVLDAGCGEGYYLRELTHAAEARHVPLQLAALDISKWAVQAAAKQDKRLTWLVASNNAIPLATDSVDTVLCVFGFPVEAEFLRVLKPGGRLIMVDPAPQHLLELRQIIYPQIKTKSAQLPVSNGSWTMEFEQRVTFNTLLSDNESIKDLLMMTPHLYRASQAGREQAESLSQLPFTADVWIREFKPKLDTPE